MSNQFYDEGEPRKGRKILLATTCYGTTSAAYTFAIARSREALHKLEIQTAYLLLQGNCHVDDARNSVVRDFLGSDCDELIFLDADVDWEPPALVQLASRDFDIVGGVYPYRRDGSDDMPCRMMGERQIRPDGLIEVEGLPTGFLKIKRHVLEKLAALAPAYFDKVYETRQVFARPVPGPDKTRWGGDIDFCNRWRALGGRLYADAELRLGHTGTIVIRDSLAAHIRRLSGTAFSYLVPKFRDGTETDADYNEVFKYIGNNYAADPGVLALLVGVARKCRGAIIETGSGLSSVLMGAICQARGDKVYSLEHVEHYAAQTVAWCEEAGVDNVGVCFAPMQDFWYDLPRFDLPNKFALGFCDGPPRMYGTRSRFFTDIAPRCSAIVVDDVKQDVNYLRQVSEWAEASGRTFEILGRAALLLKPEHRQQQEAA
jgi:predicted O-methyltransferase YrrM